MNQLRDVPLRYEPEVVFVGSGAAEEFRTRIGIALFDFLKAIFYELTFHGSPTERDEVRDELRRRVEEIERGDVELIPGEQVLDEVRERLDRREE